MSPRHDRAIRDPASRRWVSTPNTYERRYRNEAWAILAGLVVVSVSMLVVRNGNVGNAEESVFLAVNGWPDALRQPMWVFQIFGSLAFVAAAAATALFARRIRLGLAIALAIPLKLALEWWVVKALVQRERPFFTVPDAIVRDANTSALGFPSGHAILAFALAGLLAPYLRRRGVVVVYSLAALNGVARVYLGAHNPLDVIAGAGLGIAIAAAINLLVEVPSDSDLKAAGSSQPED